MTTVLSLKNLTTAINTSNGIAVPVDQVSFSIRRGETYALLGESGCGKSMTALSIMQLLPPASFFVKGSEILLGEQNLLAFSEAQMRDVRGLRIGMIFQEPMTSLNPVLSVGEQIGEVLQAHMGLSGSQKKERVLSLMNSVGIPESERRIDDFPHQLSGGMKQRVMIAMAIAAEPDLLIADEPTTALDVTIQAQVLKLLKDIQVKKGMSILLITHDLGVVKQMADKVGVMYAGHLVEEARSKDFFSDPRHPYSRKLFDSLPLMSKRSKALSIIKGMVPPLTTTFKACRFAERCPHAWDECYSVLPAWTPVEEHGHVRCHIFDDNFPAKHSQIIEGKKEHVEKKVTIKSSKEKSLLNAKNLKIHFPIKKGFLKRTVGYVKAVDGVDISIPKGKTLALVGESGSGKTTTGKGILQLLKISGGQVIFDDVDLTRLSSRALHKKRREFQFIFQDPYSSMNPRMLVGQIIAEGMQVKHNAQIQREKVGELLAHVGLPLDAQDRYPHEFSGGQRQRICIARALAVKPRLIICDEPTSALDVSVQAQILNLLKHLQEELGLSYLFITHNIAVVSYLADEVAVMYQGRIVEKGGVEDVLMAPKHAYTKTLLNAVPQVEEVCHREVVER